MESCPACSKSRNPCELYLPLFYRARGLDDLQAAERELAAAGEDVAHEERRHKLALGRLQKRRAQIERLVRRSRELREDLVLPESDEEP